MAVGIGVGWGSEWGCTFGVDTAVSVSDAGADQPCDDALTSCAPGLLCVSLRCRTPCTTSTDCPSAERCLGVTLPDGGASARVCVDRVTMTCSPNCTGNCDCTGPGCSFCPNGTICGSDGQCRDQCGQSGSSACAGGDRCAMMGGVCVGTAPHDVSPLSDGG